MQEESHKGERCPYAIKTCQEGICSNCEIYKVYKKIGIDHYKINL